VRDELGRFIKGHNVSKKWRKEFSIRYKGKHFAPQSEIKKGEHKSLNTEFKKGSTLWIGKKHTEESKNKMSKTRLGKPNFKIRGAKSNLWKGGITPINKALRESLEYEEWRRAVFERDLYTCQMCFEIGGILNADHIKPFSLYPELRLKIDNGRTLCHDCHKTTDTYGSKVYKLLNRKEILNWHK